MENNEELPLEMSILRDACTEIINMILCQTNAKFCLNTIALLNKKYNAIVKDIVFDLKLFGERPINKYNHHLMVEASKRTYSAYREELRLELQYMCPKICRPLFRNKKVPRNGYVLDGGILHKYMLSKKCEFYGPKTLNVFFDVLIEKNFDGLSSAYLEMARKSSVSLNDNFNRIKKRLNVIPMQTDGYVYGSSEIIATVDFATFVLVKKGLGEYTISYDEVRRIGYMFVVQRKLVKLKKLPPK